MSDDKHKSGSGQKDKAPVKKSVISMHENVTVSDDCCSCEAEPYWIEAMEATDEPEDSALLENKIEN